MQITEHEALADLQRLSRRERNSRVRIRLQAIILAYQGQTSRRIGESLGVSDRSVRSWVERFNEGGASALEERPKSGRPAHLKDEDIPLFMARIEAGAQPQDGVCSLRGPDLVRILSEEFNASYTQSGVYVLLHRLGYSSLMPRPRHHKSDPAAQETFKKTSPLKLTNQ